MTRIKLCGMTRQEDILTVNALLPDYVGFVFWEKSRRAVTAEKAGELRALLDPRISPVGVFVDAPEDEVAALFEAGIIDAAQLHGSEDQAYIAALKLRGIPVISAYQLGSADPETVEARVRTAEGSDADLILFDAGKGDGMVFNWETIRQVRRPYFLAGGLNPENAAEAIRTLHPFAVDVSSGIETDGKKDPEKMARFVQAVRKEDET